MTKTTPAPPATNAVSQCVPALSLLCLAVGSFAIAAHALNSIGRR